MSSEDIGGLFCLFGLLIITGVAIYSSFHFFGKLVGWSSVGVTLMFYGYVISEANK